MPLIMKLPDFNRSWTRKIFPAHRVAETIQGIAAVEILVHANAVGAMTLQAIYEAKHHGAADEHLWVKGN